MRVIISPPTWLERMRRSHAAVGVGKVPRFCGISRVILSPIWWQLWQPDFSELIQSPCVAMGLPPPLGACIGNASFGGIFTIESQ